MQPSKIYWIGEGGFNEGNMLKLVQVEFSPFHHFKSVKSEVQFKFVRWIKNLHFDLNDWIKILHVNYMFFDGSFLDGFHNN